jgi:hypothetical protein
LLLLHKQYIFSLHSIKFFMFYDDDENMREWFQLFYFLLFTSENTENNKNNTSINPSNHAQNHISPL